jgi:surfeit locus 1 family protein
MTSTVELPSRLRRANLLVPAIATACAFAILLGLGTWQWNRKAWKQELVATIAARSAAPPIDAAAFAKLRCEGVEKVGLARTCDYVSVQLSGTFDLANERHIYTGIEKPPGGVGGQGFWLMAPFQIAGTGQTIVVNRGFVPETRKDPATRPEGQPAGVVTFTGLIRSAEPRATFTAANDVARNIWFIRNPAELFPASALPKIERPELYVELLKPAPPGGLPQPPSGQISIPNRHLEYALTWWALAATLLGVFGAFAASRLRAPR